MIIIPLGEGCNISWKLQKNNLKSKSSIFEWFLSISFKDINKIVHKIVYDEPIEITKRYNDSGIERDIYLHDTAIRSAHYSLDNFPEKLERRIQRFKEQVSSNNNILFIREENNAYNTTVEDIDQFKQLIKIFNPNCNYKILLLMPFEIIKEPLQIEDLYHKQNLRDQDNLLQYIIEIEQTYTIN